jgi:hypothetical protein
MRWQIPSYTTLFHNELYRFPLNAVNLIANGRGERANDGRLSQEKRDEFGREEEYLRSLQIYPPKVHVKPWSNLAKSCWSSGGIWGFAAAVALGFYKFAWPIAYLGAKIAYAKVPEALGGGEKIARTLQRAEDQWAQHTKATLDVVLNNSEDSHRPNPKMTKPLGRLVSSQSSAMFRLDKGPGPSDSFSGSDVFISRLDPGQTSLSMVFANGGISLAQRNIFDGIEEWPAQIKASLRALRFPKDMGQVRAAVKFATNFSWLNHPSGLEGWPRIAPQYAEAMAIVPHLDHLVIANAGRSRAFFVSQEAVRPLIVAHSRTEVSENVRAEAIGQLFPNISSSRAVLLGDPDNGCFRPQISIISRQELRQGAVVAVSPEVVDLFDREEWEEIMRQAVRDGATSGVQKMAKEARNRGFFKSGFMAIYREDATAPALVVPRGPFPS